MKASTLVAVVAAIVPWIAGAPADAQPREEHGGRVPYGQRRRPPPPPPRDGDWVSLATPTPTRFGTEWIPVGRDAGPLRTLRIQAVSGIVHLRRVEVNFAGGRAAVYNVDRWLDVRHPAAIIDLGGRQYVDQIAVTTARRPAGSYSVQGSWRLAPTGVLVSMR